jgi:hypothetical protein
MKTETEYANTDFDLKSKSPFDTLNRELEESCCVLHYTHGDDGHWHSSVESVLDDGESKRDAEMDILAIIEALKSLSLPAKAELESCYLREFNIGFRCCDTWAYVHTLKSFTVQAVADAGCSLSVTLYPMRNPDGSAKQ